VKTTGLLARLDVATRHWHAAVDEPWLDLLRPDVSRVDYLAQLVRMYGLVAPFESACKYTTGLGRVLDFRQLTRAGLIAQDLLALGLRPAEVAAVPQCGSITPFHSLAEALGWAYVIERSTLLNDGVHRRLVARIPHINDARAYLSLYDGRVSEQWSTFGRLVDRFGAKPESADEILAAAHTGFATAQQWFRNGRGEAKRAG
jgi:heme oxygenase